MPDNEQPNSDQPETPEIVPSTDQLPITVCEYIENAIFQCEVSGPLKTQGDVTEPSVSVLTVG